jgi:hypothetical protein
MVDRTKEGLDSTSTYASWAIDYDHLIEENASLLEESSELAPISEDTSADDSAAFLALTAITALGRERGVREENLTPSKLDIQNFAFIVASSTAYDQPMPVHTWDPYPDGRSDVGSDPLRRKAGQEPEVIIPLRIIMSLVFAAMLLTTGILLLVADKIVGHYGFLETFFFLFAGAGLGISSVGFLRSIKRRFAAGEPL